MCSKGCEQSFPCSACSGLIRNWNEGVAILHVELPDGDVDVQVGSFVVVPS
jgi:hypothetical protein